MVTSSSAQARGWSASATAPAIAPEATCDEEPLLLLGRADLADHGGELGDGGQQRPGGDGPAELFDDDGGLQDGQADAAVLLGDGQGGPVERDHGAPELLGRLTGLDDGAHDIDRALLFEERTDRGTQLFLLIRELELHRIPFPASPVASPIPFLGPGRSGRVYLTPLSASEGVCYLHAAPFSGKNVVWCALGRSPDHGASPGRRHGGREAVGPTLPSHESRSPTLSGAPLAQRQSNGLLIRRFRVRIPRGAPQGAPHGRTSWVHQLGLTPLGRVVGLTKWTRALEYGLTLALLKERRNELPSRRPRSVSRRPRLSACQSNTDRTSAI